MDLSKLNRKISLLCPTCGNDQFETIDDNPNSEMYKCPSCKRIISHDELFNENGSLIESEFDEIREEATKMVKDEFDKMLKKTFGKSKHFKLS